MLSFNGGQLTSDTVTWLTAACLLHVSGYLRRFDVPSCSTLILVTKIRSHDPSGGVLRALLPGRAFLETGQRLARLFGAGKAGRPGQRRFEIGARPLGPPGLQLRHGEVIADHA